MKFYLICFLFLSFMSFGQNCDSTNWAQPGTYEVSYDPNSFEGGNVPNHPIMLSGDDLCFIEANRKPTENNIIHIGSYIVTIYPAKKFAPNEINE